MGNRKGAHHHKSNVVVDEKRTFSGKHHTISFSKKVALSDEELAKIRRYTKRASSIDHKPIRGAHGIKIRAPATPKIRKCESCGAPLFRNVGYAHEEYEFMGVKTSISLNIDECSVCEKRFPQEADIEESDFLKLKFRDRIQAHNRL
jgi:hypothetical protein